MHLFQLSPFLAIKNKTTSRSGFITVPGCILPKSSPSYRGVLLYYKKTPEIPHLTLARYLHSSRRATQIPPPPPNLGHFAGSISPQQEERLKTHTSPHPELFFTFDMSSPGQRRAAKTPAVPSRPPSYSAGGALHISTAGRTTQQTTPSPPPSPGATLYFHSKKWWRAPWAD